MDENTQPQSNKFLAGTAVFVVIAIIVFVLNASNTPKAPSAPVTTETEMTSPTSENKMVDGFVDGTYEAMGEYTSPAGPEKISVSLTLENGVVVDSTVVPQAVNPNSVKFQGIFTENYKAQVIGKKISELKLDKVSGSSLSPKGFNNAVEKITAEAKQS